MGGGIDPDSIAPSKNTTSSSSVGPITPSFKGV